MTSQNQTKYILLECVTQDGKIAASIDQLGVLWRVSDAEDTGTINPLREKIVSYDREAVEEAVRDFFTRMKQSGLPGYLDSGNLRASHDTPLDFACRLTEEIHDDLPDVAAEDFRDDDFDNHTLAPLREAMVDNCPEFSGETVEPEGGAPDLL